MGFDWIGELFKKLLPKEDSFSQALYTFDIGQNDLTAGYKLNLTTEQVKAYVPDVLSQLYNTIKVRFEYPNCKTDFFILFLIFMHLFILGLLFPFAECVWSRRKIILDTQYRPCRLSALHFGPVSCHSSPNW